MVFTDKIPASIIYKLQVVLLLLSGIGLLLSPHKGFVAIGKFVAFYLILFSAAQLITSLKINKAKAWSPIIASILSISIGIQILTQSITIFINIIAVWLTVYGIFEIARIAIHYSEIRMWGLQLFVALSSLTFASVVWFNWPLEGLTHLAYFLGPNFIILAITTAYAKTPITIN